MVSIIIPTYKRTTYLERAIESVLNQSYSNIEVIVVDDNGQGKQQDETKSIIEKYTNVKLITYEKNKGACHARNMGVTHALGNIIMFLDDDDYYLPEKIAIQVKEFNNDDIDACLCAMKRIDDNDNEIISQENFPRGEDLKSYILNGNCFTSMIAIKKDIFLKIGGFSEIPRFQDKFFMYKFHENKLKVKLLQEQLFVLTEHNGERVSLGSISKISKALTLLYQFEKKHFDLLEIKEQISVKRRFNKALANIRTNAPVNERIKGLYFLTKSNLFLIEKDFSKQKILMRLILSDEFYDKLKNKLC